MDAERFAAQPPRLSAAGCSGVLGRSIRKTGRSRFVAKAFDASPFRFVPRENLIIVLTDVICDSHYCCFKLLRRKHVAMEAATTTENIAIDRKIAGCSPCSLKMYLELRI